MATWHFITYRQYGYWDFELRSSVPVPTYVESGPISCFRQHREQTVPNPA
jgi:hypothetical protein